MILLQVLLFVNFILSTSEDRAGRSRYRSYSQQRPSTRAQTPSSTRTTSTLPPDPTHGLYPFPRAEHARTTSRFQRSTSESDLRSSRPESSRFLQTSTATGYQHSVRSTSESTTRPTPTPRSFTSLPRYDPLPWERQTSPSRRSQSADRASSSRQSPSTPAPSYSHRFSTSLTSSSAAIPLPAPSTQVTKPKEETSCSTRYERPWDSSRPSTSSYRTQTWRSTPSTSARDTTPSRYDPRRVQWPSSTPIETVETAKSTRPKQRKPRKYRFQTQYVHKIRLFVPEEEPIPDMPLSRASQAIIDGSRTRRSPVPERSKPPKFTDWKPAEIYKPTPLRAAQIHDPSETKWQREWREKREAERRRSELERERQESEERAERQRDEEKRRRAERQREEERRRETEKRRREEEERRRWRKTYLSQSSSESEEEVQILKSLDYSFSPRDSIQTSDLGLIPLPDECDGSFTVQSVLTALYHCEILRDLLQKQTTHQHVPLSQNLTEVFDLMDGNCSSSQISRKKHRMISAVDNLLKELKYDPKETKNPTKLLALILFEFVKKLKDLPSQTPFQIKVRKVIKCDKCGKSGYTPSTVSRPYDFYDPCGSSLDTQLLELLKPDPIVQARECLCAGIKTTLKDIMIAELGEMFVLSASQEKPKASRTRTVILNRNMRLGDSGVYTLSFFMVEMKKETSLFFKRNGEWFYVSKKGIFRVFDISQFATGNVDISLCAYQKRLSS